MKPRRSFTVFLTSFFLCLGTSSLEALGQCDPTVDSTAEIHSSDTPYGGSDTTLWVCSGTDFDLSDFNSNKQENLKILAEENVTITCANTGGNVGHTIYLPSGGDLTLDDDASNCTVYHESNTQITDNGTNNDLISCSDLSYDYSNAPSGGILTGPCDRTTTSLAAHKTQGDEIEAWGTEAGLRTQIPSKLLQERDDLRLSVHNSLGKKVLDRRLRSSRERFELDLASGVYIATFRAEDQGSLDSEKFVISD